jgi:hypothetical protein
MADIVSFLMAVPKRKGAPSLTLKDIREDARCPYCIQDDKFRVMNVLSNGRLICGNCGHIVFPDDSAFKCPCLKCVEINFSPKIRRLRGAKDRTRSNSKPTPSRPASNAFPITRLRAALRATKIFLATLLAPRG